MAVSKEQLAQYVAELALPQEQTDQLVTTLLANEKAATQFVGQRLRHDDYTKKTQELAGHKQQLEQTATTQITQYAQQLNNANNRIAEIMSELEAKEISAAQANARLRSVKEKFNLSDDDIPALEVKNPAGTGTDPNKGGSGSIDIDKKLNDFKTELLTTIRGELVTMPRLTAIQSDIAFEHQELTGKRLSRADQEKLLKTAQEKKITLEQAWEQEFGISDIRFNKRLEEELKKREDAREAERRQRASEEALAGVKRGVDPTFQAQTPILKKNFVSEPAPQTQQQQQQQQQQTPPAHRLSGAERAAAKFLERRNNGVAMGAPQPAA